MTVKVGVAGMAAVSSVNVLLEFTYQLSVRLSVCGWPAMCPLHGTAREAVVTCMWQVPLHAELDCKLSCVQAS